MTILQELGAAVMGGFLENRSDDLKSYFLSNPISTRNECEDVASI